MQEGQFSENRVGIERVHGDHMAWLLQSRLLPAEGRHVGNRYVRISIMGKNRGLGRQEIYNRQILGPALEQRRVRTQEMAAGIAGIPTLAAKFKQSLKFEAKRHLPRAKGDLAVNGRVFRALGYFDCERDFSGQRHFAGAIDVVPALSVQENVTAHILIASDRELGDAAERRVRYPRSVGNVHEAWQGLAGRRIRNTTHTF